MAPKQARGAGRGRGKGRASKGAPKAAAPESPESSNPFESSDEQRADDEPTGAAGEAEAEGRARARAGAGADEADKTIPPELMTRVLHEFFARDATRISRDANAAVGKYVDVFVREAIARAAVEKKGGFLEVSQAERSGARAGLGRE